VTDQGAVLGEGELVSGKSTSGVARRVVTIDDVLELLDDPGLGEMILLTDSASATAIMPLLPEVRGVICSAGGRTSHLATVSRELGLSCVVGTSFPGEVDVDGRRVVIADDGKVMSGEG
jgi:phosphohistidine swiveling domain-containing protein